MHVSSDTWIMCFLVCETGHVESMLWWHRLFCDTKCLATQWILSPPASTAKEGRGACYQNISPKSTAPVKNNTLVSSILLDSIIDSEPIEISGLLTLYHTYIKDIRCHEVEYLTLSVCLLSRHVKPLNCCSKRNIQSRKGFQDPAVHCPYTNKLMTVWT